LNKIFEFFSFARETEIRLLFEFMLAAQYQEQVLTLATLFC